MKAIFVSTLLVLSFGVANAEVTLDNSDAEKISQPYKGAKCTAKQEGKNVKIIVDYPGKDSQTLTFGAASDAKETDGTIDKFDRLSLFSPATAIFILENLKKEGCEIDASEIEEMTKISEELSLYIEKFFAEEWEDLESKRKN